MIGRFHPLFLLAVISLNYFNTRAIAQCVEILVLPGRPMMVRRFVYYARRKVFDQDDLMIIAQKRLDEKHEIKPFVGGITEQPVIEIAAINIDNRSLLVHRSARASVSRSPAPPPRKLAG